MGKILLIGDYSNCHSNLARGLRELGHNVTLMRQLNYLSSKEVDFDISRKPGKIGGLQLFLKSFLSLHKYMKGFDIVAFNDPIFLSLKPKYVKIIFDRLRKENGYLYYTAMSTDINYLEMCGRKDMPLKHNEFFIDGKPSPWYLENPKRWEDWHNRALLNYQNHFFDNIHGAVSVLYEYHVGLRNRYPEEKIGYGGIPVDTANIPFIGAGEGNKIHILLCRDPYRIKMKGSDILEKAAIKIAQKYPDKIEFSIAENLPFNIFMEKLKTSDLVLDQVYSYTPATTALIAMAMGKTVVTGGEEEFYNFIKEKENRPIIPASYNPEILEKKLEEVISDKEFIKNNSLKSRNFIIKHNDMKVVAQRFLDIWSRNLSIIN